MKATAKPFRTNFYLWNGVAALFFSACVTNRHSHNTMQLFVDLQSGFKCKINDEGWKTYKLLILRENVVHQLDTNGSVQLLIYLDKDASIAQRLKATYLGDRDAGIPDIPVRSLIHPEILQRAILQPDPKYLLRVISDIFKLLAGEDNPSVIDARVSRVEQLIAVTNPDLLSSCYLAAQVFLSESRLRALFKQQAGVSLHKYLMWNRLQRSINQIMSGSTVVEAALIAGFTDTSHFHKMLVRMFGVSPSRFIKDNQSMCIVTCDDTPLRFESRVFE